jgi:protein-S-isoprenylcysteine O-methyltransferase Ste14
VRGVTDKPDSPGVQFPPPFLFVLGILLGWLIGKWIVLPFPPLPPLLGWVLIGAGLLLALSAVTRFFRARTHLIPNRPATALVVAGPYRFTRNPMYVSLTAVYLGVCVLMQSLWALVLLPLVLLTIYRKVIAPEEAYLERRFGDEYVLYMKRVRRWL